MSLNLNWYKSYDTKRKNSKNANLCFWTKLQKNGNGNISFLCHNLWTNQNLLEFRPVKHVIMTVWTSVLWKMNIHISKKWPELVITLSFIKGHSFPISLYLSMGKFVLFSTLCYFSVFFTELFFWNFLAQTLVMPFMVYKKLSIDNFLALLLELFLILTW